MRNKGLAIFIGVIAVTAIAVYAIFGDFDLTGKETKPESAHSAAVEFNEVMANNGGAVPDENGNFSDWLELYNSSDQAVKLKGWGLSDEANVSAKWVFPDIELAAKGYLVVFCSGKSISDAHAQYQHTNFKLKAGTDALTLTDPSGAKVDMLTLPASTTGRSIGRTVGTDEWAELQDPTPGFENSEQGRADYVKSMDASAIGLVISEVQSSNQTTIADNTGAYSDWIEIANPTGSAVDLTGFGLSDDPSSPLKWRFPKGTTIDKGQVLLVFASDRADPSGGAVEGQLHASFKLSANSDTVVLSSKNGKVIDREEVKELAGDMSAVLTDTGWGVTSKPTPGYPNTDTGYEEFAKEHPLPLGELVISEASNTNMSTIESAKGVYSDWVELHNTTSQPINLKDYTLTDNTGNPAKWRFPDTTIDAGGYLVIFAAEANPKDEKHLYTGFGLNAESELVALYNAQGKLQDKMPVANLKQDMSVGRMDNEAGIYYFSKPTPGAANADGAQAMLHMPTASVPAGRYESEQHIALQAEKGAKIYYTLDGSDPSESSTLYDGEITVSAQNDTLPKGTVIRAIAYEEGHVPSRIMTASYFIQVPHTLPIVSLSTNPANLFDENTGIYVHGPKPVTELPFPEANWSKDTEVPVNFQFIDENGKLGVGLDAGIRINGAYSRGYPQKGLAILSRSQYGSKTIHYAFFPNRPFTEYKDVVLRASGQDQPYSRIRESLMSSLCDGQVNSEVQAFRQVVVYINGAYWGVYDLQEKLNKYFMASHANVSNPDNIDILFANGTVINGSNKDWKDLMAYVKSHDLSVQENFDAVAGRIDVDNYTDYVITEIILGNSDQANIKYWRENKAGAKWRWVLADFDWAFFNVNHDSVLEYLNPEGTGVGNGLDNSLIRGLLKNPAYKEKFMERFAYLLENVFNKERMLEKIDSLSKEIEDEMKRDRIKWPNNYLGDSIGSQEQWKKNQIGRLTKFAQNREPVVLWSFQKFFGLSDEKTIALFGKVGKAPASS